MTTDLKTAAAATTRSLFATCLLLFGVFQLLVSCTDYQIESRPLSAATLDLLTPPPPPVRHARILLQAGLVVAVLVAAAGRRAGRGRGRAPQPGRGGGESPGPPADLQLRLPAGVGGAGRLLRGGRPRPPAACRPGPPVAARRPGQCHARRGGAVVLGGGHRPEEEERRVRGAAGRPAGLHHRPGPLLHGRLTVTEGGHLAAPAAPAALLLSAPGAVRLPAPPHVAVSAEGLVVLAAVAALRQRRYAPRARRRAPGPVGVAAGRHGATALLAVRQHHGHAAAPLLRAHVPDGHQGRHVGQARRGHRCLAEGGSGRRAGAGTPLWLHPSLSPPHFLSRQCQQRMVELVFTLPS